MAAKSSSVSFLVSKTFPATLHSNILCASALGIALYKLIFSIMLTLADVTQINFQGLPLARSTLLFADIRPRCLPPVIW